MRTTEPETERRQYRTATFGRIVCGINGSRADEETVRQAAILSGSEGTLEVVCVVDTRGYGASAQASIAPARAEAALAEARRCAKEQGTGARTSLVHGASPWQSLAETAAGADLLVVGPGGAGSRAGGIMLGTVATEAVHHAEVPVLIARPSRGTPFPEQILLASDGSPGSRAAADLAITVARVHGSEITLFTAGEETPTGRHALAEQAADIELATGRKPVVVTRSQPARTAIVEHALVEQPALVVIGSSGKVGFRALGSVSEHVAHHVPASVMVARTSRTKEEAR